MKRLLPALLMVLMVACEPEDDGLSDIPCVPLTFEEEAVIAFRATEPRFTGEYVETHDDGIYHCRRCGRPLFESQYKFNSGSGWPAFDRAIEGAVSETPDPDGYRTEITCAYCGGHLGHVFRGEGFTETSTRHCVNSISLKFLPSDPAAAESNREFLDTRCQFAYFAAGDFRALEYCTEVEPGVIKAETGYMGGTTDNPSFADVQAGGTGHAQTVRVEYDPSVVNYKTLALRFMELHDPTFAPLDDQFRSAMFFVNDEQHYTALDVIEIMIKRGVTPVTDVAPASHFWISPNAFQDFYFDQQVQPTCGE